MSRVDEFASALGSRIARIEWRDGSNTSWGDDFVQDPSDGDKKVSELTGAANGEGIVAVTHADASTRVYVVKVGQRVIWDSARGTYTFPG
jgi:hypothetical protein